MLIKLKILLVMALKAVYSKLPIRKTIGQWKAIVIQKYDTEINRYLKEQEENKRESIRLHSLSEKYRTVNYQVIPLWRMCVEAHSFNDTDPHVTKRGIVLYEDTADNIYERIDAAYIFESDSLWGDSHCSEKITSIIENWDKGIELSPPFFLKKEDNNQILIQDGKHRITVARAMNASTIPFFVRLEDQSWINEILPCAKKMNY